MPTAYATPEQLAQLSVAARAIAGIPTADKEAALLANSRRADGYLAQQFTVPLSAWNEDLSRAVCDWTTYDLLSVRGYNPEAPGDVNVRLRALDATRWFEAIAAGEVIPQVTGGDGAEATDRPSLFPEIDSDDPRGW